MGWWTGGEGHWRDLVRRTERHIVTSMIPRGRMRTLWSGQTVFGVKLQNRVVWLRPSIKRSINISDLEKLSLYWWEIGCELRFPPWVRGRSMNSFHPALISQMLLMTYLWSQPQRLYWSERPMIWCVCAESERNQNREALKCVGVCTSLYFPRDQTLPRVKGQRSSTRPRSRRINIAPELIQFPHNTAYTQKWNPFK